MISVIKLGGSLLSAEAMPACLGKIAEYPGNIVIVPGGGVFADQVRTAQQTWKFDDVAAHGMAVLAMRQMALLMNSLFPQYGLIEHPERLDGAMRVGIWLPDLKLLNEAGVAADWQVTSDSLAAWLAAKIRATALLLIKSCAIDEQTPLHDLQQQGIIDAAFFDYADLSIPTTVIGKDRFLNSAC